MEDWKSRTTLLLGDDKMKNLAKKNVLVVGLGGVGAYAAEMICRSGVEQMTIVDADTVNITNLNRQLIALHSNINKPKAELLGQRLLDINPNLKLTILNEFLKEERILEVLNMQHYNYVVDAIDTLSPKIYLIFHAHSLGIPVISSMGAGGKTDPSKIEICDLTKTYNCGLAKAVRKRLKSKGVNKGIKTVFSSELTLKEAVVEVKGEENKRSVLGTISYLPAMFGCFLASEVIKDLCITE